MIVLFLLIQIRYVTEILKSDKYDHVWKTVSQTLLIPRHICLIYNSGQGPECEVIDHEDHNQGLLRHCVISFLDSKTWKISRIGQTKKKFFST